MLVLPDQVLCSLWGASVAALQHGEGRLHFAITKTHFYSRELTYSNLANIKSAPIMCENKQLCVVQCNKTETYLQEQLRGGDLAT